MIDEFVQVFRNHGEFCASQPWEVIVATLTFLVCILTVWGSRGAAEAANSLATNNTQQNVASEVSINLLIYVHKKCL